MLRLTLSIVIVPLCFQIPDAGAQQLIGVRHHGPEIRTIQSISDESTTATPIVRPAVSVVTPGTSGLSAPLPQPMIGPAVNQSTEGTDPAQAVAMDSPTDSASEPSVKFGGWIQTGFHSQSTGLFNDRPDSVNLHQFWMYLEKEAARNYEWDWGFRADLMYGIDASKTQSFGNPAGTWDFANGWDFGAYGWAMPQAYGELARENLSIKLGHFYTLVGYEVVTAPDNFFYSHAYTMFNSEPFTHTGALASYDLNDSLTVHGGWTLGWDTGFNQVNGGSSFLGGFSKGLSEDVTFTYIATAGKLGWRGNGYTHSLVLDRQLGEKLNYVFQSDLVSTDQTGGNNSEVGINQYLLYTLSERLRAGTRMEWWKSDISGSSESTYALTGGFNFTPSENLILRPEVRYNWGADLVGADMDTPIFGIDAIIKF